MNLSEELSFEIINLYVKKKCKKCFGRGYRMWEVPKAKHGFRRNEPFIRYGDYCDCVKKNLKEAS